MWRKLVPSPPPMFMNAASKPARFAIAATRGVTQPASPKGVGKRPNWLA